MRTIIAGHGEIGKALSEVLDCYTPSIVDIDKSKCKGYTEGEFDILHVAIPYSETFKDIVVGYQERFNPRFTIIHSTVPVGTSRDLGAVFSPVVGIHPHLAPSLKAFTKFLGGEQAGKVANYFRRAGLKVYLFDKQETLELAKLSQTTLYAMQIEYVKTFKKICEKLNLSFPEAYTIPSEDYNKGYSKLGYPEFSFPLLTPILTPQGGHCTIPNLEFLPQEFAAVKQFIKQSNEQFS